MPSSPAAVPSQRGLCCHEHTCDRTATGSVGPSLGLSLLRSHPAGLGRGSLLYLTSQDAGTKGKLGPQEPQAYGSRHFCQRWRSSCPALTPPASTAPIWRVSSFPHSWATPGPWAGPPLARGSGCPGAHRAEPPVLRQAALWRPLAGGRVPGGLREAGGAAAPRPALPGARDSAPGERDEAPTEPSRAASRDHVPPVEGRSLGELPG